MKSATIIVRLVGCLAALSMLVGLAVAQRPEDNEPTSALSFLVIKEDNGKPVRNAAVIIHPVSAKGKQGRGGIELKTDTEGKCGFEEIPYGKLRVQVLAQGFQTWGEDFDVDKAKMDFTIKLRRPQGQYSVYGNQTDDKKPAPDPNAKPQ
jgi:hypothetical protein